MKKNNFWIALFLLVNIAIIGITMSSCGDDDIDEDNSVSNNSIVGTWILATRDNVDMFSYGSTLVLEIGENGYIVQTAHYKGGRKGTTLTFPYSYDGNTGTVKYQGESYQGKVVVNDDKMILYGPYTDIYQRITSAELNSFLNSWK